MSLQLAKAWVDSAVQNPIAKADALRALEQAKVQGVEGTILVGPGLSGSGRCFLGRWDGRELVVRELTPQQQQDWAIEPKALFLQLDPPAIPRRDVPLDPLVSLSINHITGAHSHSGWEPLSGSCVAEIVAVPPEAIRNCALRAKYFRPDLNRQMTAMWYADMDLHDAPTELHFRFSPLFSENNPQHCQGILVLFLQLLTADDWQSQAGCRVISNVADAVIMLR